MAKMKVCPSCYATVDAKARFCGLCGADLAAVVTTVDDLIGQVIADRYSIESLLGHGGMGDVYLAYDRGLDDRPVAVKIVNKRFRSDTTVLTRFKTEARSIARIQHPNAVQLYQDGFLDDGTLFLIMEYVRGRNLADHMHQHGELSHRLALKLSFQLAGVLAAAHLQGVIHRDLKPDNIMLTEATPGRYQIKVLDFGIAKLLDDPASRLTQAGMVFGTPEFMSPEQAEGHDVDHRADIYSVGMILYFMLTHRLPFEGKNQLAILNKQIREVPAPPSERRPDLEIDPFFESVIMKCLEKPAESRYDSCEQLLNDLDRVTEGLQPNAFGASGVLATVEGDWSDSNEPLNGIDTSEGLSKLSGDLPAVANSSTWVSESQDLPLFGSDEYERLEEVGDDALVFEEVPTAADPRATRSGEARVVAPVSVGDDGFAFGDFSEDSTPSLSLGGDDEGGLELGLGELDVDHHYSGRRRSGGGGGMGLMVFLLLVVGVGVAAFFLLSKEADKEPEEPQHFGPDVTSISNADPTPDASSPADVVTPDVAETTTTEPDTTKAPVVEALPTPVAMGPGLRRAVVASLVIDRASYFLESGKFESVDGILDSDLPKNKALPPRLLQRAKAVRGKNNQIRRLLKEGLSAAKSTRSCHAAEEILEDLRDLSDKAAATLNTKVRACKHRLNSAPTSLPE